MPSSTWRRSFGYLVCNSVRCFLIRANEFADDVPLEWAMSHIITVLCAAPQAKARLMLRRQHGERHAGRLGRPRPSLHIQHRGRETLGRNLTLFAGTSEGRYAVVDIEAVFQVGGVGHSRQRVVLIAEAAPGQVIRYEQRRGIVSLEFLGGLKPPFTAVSAEGFPGQPARK